MLSSASQTLLHSVSFCLHDRDVSPLLAQMHWDIFPMNKLSFRPFLLVCISNSLPFFLIRVVSLFTPSTASSNHSQLQYYDISFLLRLLMLFHYAFLFHFLCSLLLFHIYSAIKTSVALVHSWRLLFYSHTQFEWWWLYMLKRGMKIYRERSSKYISYHYEEKL